MRRYLFRNDYSFGAHPKVLAALAETNLEGNAGYGDDPYCGRAQDLIRDLCQCPQAKVEFLIGGTQTNFTAIAAFLRPWEGVIAAESSHINGHESGAVEATGHKILPLPTGPDGKLTPEQLLPLLERHKDVHLVKPRLVEIADATESGMVYTKAELTALSRLCRDNGLLLFLDGARLGSALASPASDLTLPDLARLTDAFTIGGTKNGALLGEALILPRPHDHFRWYMKQRGAVLAKGRLLGLQFQALLTDGLYFDLARHANTLAIRLRDGMAALGIPFPVSSPSNQQFPVLGNEVVAALEERGYEFETDHPVDEKRTCVRFVTSWATPESAVEELLADLEGILKAE